MMESGEFEARMREREYFHGIRLLPGAWPVIRVDGRGFSRYTESRYDKPFDARFRDRMVATAQALMEELDGHYAYIESDEISVLFRPDWNLFSRELEKIVSISAGIASAAFSLACGERVHFDSRIWLGTGLDSVVDYFRWRQADAARCALNGWCYWTLRRSGRSVREATQALERTTIADKNELLFQHGINFNEVPIWQRRGGGLYYVSVAKEGYDPIKDAAVVTTRRKIKFDDELPMKDEYSRFLYELMRSAAAGR